MEVDQFNKKACMKACMKPCMKARKLCRRNRDDSSYQERSHEGQQETSEAGEDNTLLKKLRNYFRYFRFLLSVSSFGM